jgi:hypothetical protein
MVIIFSCLTKIKEQNQMKKPLSTNFGYSYEELVRLSRMLGYAYEKSKNPIIKAALNQIEKALKEN